MKNKILSAIVVVLTGLTMPLVVFAENFNTTTKSVDKMSLLEFVSFANFEECNVDKYSHKICMRESGKFAKWTTKEKEFVLEAMQPLNNSKLSFLVNSFLENDITKIVFVNISTGSFAASAMPLDDSAIILLHPEFFKNEVQLKSIKGVSHILLHELFHIHAVITAWEGRQKEMYSELMEILNWETPVGKFHQLSKTKGYKAALKARKKARKEGDSGRATFIDLEFSRQYDFPSLYSFASVSEYYAEIAAYLFHDKAFRGKISPELFSWVKKQPFKIFLDN